MRKINFFGISLDILSMDETLNKISSYIEENQYKKHVVINVSKFIFSINNSKLRKSIIKSDLINIDGMGIVFGLRILGYKNIKRVTGIDLFYKLIELSAQKNYSIYLLGSTEDVLELTEQNLRQKYPNLLISGKHHGFFNKNEEKKIVNQINRCNPNILFVAISSPKKEIFLERWKKDIRVNFLMGVGGTFDIVAGKTKRAPFILQNLGLEWFFRLLQEPRRMWKRYFFTNLSFCFLIFKEFLKINFKKIFN